jgi:hypothetical protein
MTNHVKRDRNTKYQNHKSKHQTTEGQDSKQHHSEQERYQLDDETLRAHYQRVIDCRKNRVNFVSGTVTPCQSNKYKKGEFVPSDIESLEIGFKYLCEMYGMNLRVSIQPKYMGSRFNMYLYRDEMEKSYSVTRNGFMCKSLSKDILKPVYESMHQRLREFMTENKITLMVLDGELLPWAALGRGLIDKEFIPVDKGLETEIKLMKKYNFDQDIPKISKEQNICDPAKIHTTSETEKMYEVYHKQMMLYADNSRDQILEYKPFGILKLCFEDGSELIPLSDHSYGQCEMYEMLRNKENPMDQQLVVDVTSENYDQMYENVRKFFEKLTLEQGYEGIVIKPDFVEPGKLPMMKCRNTEYLTIIYGYDYMTRYKLERLVKNKQTRFKMKQSIREFEQGLELLKINHNEIETNESYPQILMRYLYNESYGETLDPRL